MRPPLSSFYILIRCNGAQNKNRHDGMWCNPPLEESFRLTTVKGRWYGVDGLKRPPLRQPGLQLGSDASVQAPEAAGLNGIY